MILERFFEIPGHVFLILDFVQFFKFSQEGAESAVAKQLDGAMTYLAMFGFEISSYGLFKMMHLASVTFVGMFVLIFAIQVVQIALDWIALNNHRATCSN